MKRLSAALALLLTAACFPSAGQDRASPAIPDVALAKDGKALVDLFVLAKKSAPEPAPAKKGKGARKKARARSNFENATADLRSHLHGITGADFALHDSAQFADKPGIFIGKPEDFPWVDLPKRLEAEEFIIRTAGRSQLFLVAGSETGMVDAIYAFLEKLGCRWYFPGDTWTVIPRQPALRVALDFRQKPDIALQRNLPIGFGAHSQGTAHDTAEWTRRNRLGGTLAVVNHHMWPGIAKERDFAAHPEWFALVKGKRQGSKPCYANPEVIERGKAQALAFFESNPKAQMFSLSAPDGAGYCECPLCLKAALVAKIDRRGPAGLFGNTAAGTEVSVASETIFRYANDVARAVAKKYPDKYLGMIAYSAYAHPPSFDLEPNIYVEVTKGYRETPLTLPQQIRAFARKAQHLGIYEYYDVEQWSWDQPGWARAAHLDYHEATVPYFFQNKIHSIKGETSNNWGPNGIGYYVLSRLMWDSASDARAIEEEFCAKAFGPAAAPLKRFYRRWESGQGVNPRTLGLAHRDLDEAARLTAGLPEYRARVDRIRMYLHFLKSAHFLKDFKLLVRGKGIKRENIDKLIQRHGEAGLKKQVDHLGNYVRCLMDTHMVHSFAYNYYLKHLGNLLGCDTAQWQRPGTIPSAAEVEKVFQEDLKEFDLAALKDVDARLFSRRLVALKEVRPDLVKSSGRKPHEPFRQGSLWVPAREGDKVSLSFEPAKGVAGEQFYKVSFVPAAAFEKNRTDLEEEPYLSKKLENGVLSFEAKKAGYYNVKWTDASITGVNRPAVMRGSKELALAGATLYFFVPEGTRSFLVRSQVVAGPTLVIQDSRGQAATAERKSGAGATPDIIVAVPAGSDNSVWSISGPKNRQPHVILVGVPNYLSLLPEQLLIPRESAR